METNFQKSASNFLSPVQSTEISILLGERGLVETNFKKSTSNFQVQSCTEISILGGARGNQFPTFDAQFKFAKIQNSHVEGGVVETNFQLLMLSSNFLKSNIPMLRVGGGRGSWKPISNF